MQVRLDDDPAVERERERRYSLVDAGVAGHRAREACRAGLFGQHRRMPEPRRQHQTGQRQRCCEPRARKCERTARRDRRPKRQPESIGDDRADERGGERHERRTNHADPSRELSHPLGVVRFRRLRAHLVQGRSHLREDGPLICRSSGRTCVQALLCRTSTTRGPQKRGPDSCRTSNSRRCSPGNLAIALHTLLNATESAVLSAVPHASRAKPLAADRRDVAYTGAPQPSKAMRSDVNSSPMMRSQKLRIRCWIG